MNKKILIIGIGNTLRGDDGFGWEAVKRLEEIINHDYVQTLYRHQLTPELAEDISFHDQVFFIDASIEIQPGELSITKLNTDYKSLDHFSTHDLSPEGILNLCQYLYQKRPISYLFSVGAYTFEPIESLSPNVENTLDDVIEEILKLLDV